MPKIPLSATSAAVGAGAVAENEVVGGHGRLHQAHRLGLRGDARWAGVSLSAMASSPQTLMGLCVSGTLFVVSDPHLMEPAT